MTTNDRFILIHYHEIGLKGKNRGKFERRLMTNITRALKGVPCGKLERLSGRMMLCTHLRITDRCNPRTTLNSLWHRQLFRSSYRQTQYRSHSRNYLGTCTKNRLPILQNCHQTRRQNLSAQFGSNQPGCGQAYSNPVRSPRPDGQPRSHLFY